MPKTRKRKKHRIRMVPLVLLLLCLGGAMTGITYVVGHLLTITSNRIFPSKQEATNESYTALKNVMNTDSRMNDILSNKDAYPQELLDMLSRNSEMLDFVAEYPKKKGKVYADTIGDIQEGEIPLLLQWDERWGYGSYGDSCLAVSGCGPTALSMVIAGLREDASITPYTIAQFAQEHGYYVSGSGTSWALMSEGCQYFGVTATEITLTKEAVFGALQSGMPIICSMRPGDFTTTGHFIVLTGVKDGSIQVHDPNSRERSSRLWDYETLEYQIQNLWAFRLS